MIDLLCDVVKIKIFLLILVCTFISSPLLAQETVEDDNYKYVLKTSNAKGGIYALGFYASIFTHELGHAITPLFFFGHPTSFKPYPHKKGSQWQLGYVTWKGPRPFFPAVNPIIQFMGVGFNMLAAYFAAEGIPGATSIDGREFMIGYGYSNAIYYPLYMFSDILFNNKHSDFDQLKKQTGIPKTIFFLFGATASYFLIKRIEDFRKIKPHENQIDYKISKTDGTVSSMGLIHSPIFINDDTKISFLIDPRFGQHGISYGKSF